MLLFWNYPSVSEVEDDILAKLELYLEGEGYFSEPYPKPYHDVEIGAYKVQKDYWETLRSGCSGGLTRRSRNRCVIDFSYKLFLSYYADGKFMSEIFKVIYQRGELEIIPK